MLRPESSYYALRFEQELAMARQASSPKVAAIHAELARAYRACLPEATEESGWTEARQTARA